MARTLSLHSGLLLAWVMACGDSAVPIQAQQDAVTVRDEALELSLSVEPRTISSGEQARIRIALRNTSDRAVHLEAGGCPLLHYIENASGEVVVPQGGDWICILILQRLELAPGETRERSDTWAGESCPPANTERGCAPLPAGEYRVHATFRATTAGREVFLRTPDLGVSLRG